MIISCNRKIATRDFIFHWDCFDCILFCSFESVKIQEKKKKRTMMLNQADLTGSFVARHRC